MGNVVPALRLGVIQRLIGSIVGLFPTLPLLARSDAKAAGHTQRYGQLEIGSGNQFSQTLCRAVRLEDAGPHQEDTELFPAQTPDDVAFASPAAQDSSNFLQNQVADGMSISVVDRLEVIHVTQDQTGILPPIRRDRDAALYVVSKASTVEDVC